MNTATIIEVNTVFISYQAYKRAELDYVQPLKNVQTVTVKLKCFLTEVFCLSAVRPQFVPGKMSLTAREGGNITITCKVTGYPTPQVTWSKNENSLTEDRYHVIGWELTIVGVLFEDQGVFRCRAENVFEQTEKSVQLIVHGKMRNIYYTAYNILKLNSWTEDEEKQ